jgi:hypothetical protein
LKIDLKTLFFDFKEMMDDHVWAVYAGEHGVLQAVFLDEGPALTWAREYLHYEYAVLPVSLKE